MDLSIITVTWNSEKLIGEQIRSVSLGCKDITYEEIIVDNASPDGTVDLVKKDFPGIKLIANQENKGFGAANNQGVKIAQGEFLLFLNPDMRVQEGSLDKIVAWMKEHPKAGIASCKLVDEHGNVNPDAMPRRFPTVWNALALLLKIPHIFPHILDRYLIKDFDADTEQAVDSVRGSFMLIRRELIEKLGWAFDPRYYIWFEDVDICREAQRLGYTVMYTPIISCVDYVGQSFKKRTVWWKQKQFMKSMATYFWKWGSRSSFFRRCEELVNNHWFSFFLALVFLAIRAWTLLFYYSLFLAVFFQWRKKEKLGLFFSILALILQSGNDFSRWIAQPRFIPIIESSSVKIEGGEYQTHFAFKIFGLSQTPDICFNIKENTISSTDIKDKYGFEVNSFILINSSKERVGFKIQNPPRKHLYAVVQTKNPITTSTYSADFCYRKGL